MSNDQDADKLLTPAEVAAMFRVNAKTVTRWARSGRLSAIKTMGGHRRYRLSEVRRAVEAIPAMLDTDPELAARMATTLRKLIDVLHVESTQGKKRLAEIAALFESKAKAKTAKNGAPKEGHKQPAQPRAQTAAKPNRPHSRNLS